MSNGTTESNTRRSSLRRMILPVLAGLTLAAPITIWAGPVNVNDADATTIARELKGIGLSRARAIIAYREEHGPFRDLDDLLEVDGIGPRIIEQNRQFILLDDRGPG
jgi:competence protein ComEA